MSSLRESIEAVFCDVPHPGDDNLTVYNVEGREYDETFQLLKGTAWKDLRVNKFIRGDTPFPDLAPKAFHYFMPAFLNAILDAAADDIVADSLLFSLAPENARRTEGRFPYDNTVAYNERMELFNPAQRQVIADVFHECIRREWFAAEEIATVFDTLTPKP
ncbi:hypothetical protein N9Y42_11295, partial [Mariniblastus sp.]|nr:hypothetical protein [Mariniblastus sp.]